MYFRINSTICLLLEHKKKDACISGGALTATTVAISNMNASATVSRGSMWHNLPGKVVWILAD